MCNTVDNISQCLNCPFGGCINNNSPSPAETAVMHEAHKEETPMSAKRQYNIEYNREWRAKEKAKLIDGLVEKISDAGLLEQFLSQYKIIGLKDAKLRQLRKFAKENGLI